MQVQVYKFKISKITKPKFLNVVIIISYEISQIPDRFKVLQNIDLSY